MISTRFSSRVDFGAASFEEALLSAFSWWEKPYRWISGHESLGLLAAPAAS
jgi:hypothetical protein